MLQAIFMISTPAVVTVRGWKVHFFIRLCCSRAVAVEEDLDIFVYDWKWLFLCKIRFRTHIIIILCQMNTKKITKCWPKGGEGVNPYSQSDHKKALFWTTPLRVKWMDGVICLLSPFEMTSWHVKVWIYGHTNKKTFTRCPGKKVSFRIFYVCTTGNGSWHAPFLECELRTVRSFFNLGLGEVTL